MSRKSIKWVFIYIFLCFLVFCPAEGRDFHVFDVVGDSISYGINPEEGTYGWVQMIMGEGGGTYPPAQSTTLYSLWPSITAYNTAASGSRASDWAANNYSLLSTVMGHHPDLVVVMIGGNDFIAYSADGNVTTAEYQEYQENLNIILDTLKTLSPQPVILLVNYHDLFDGYSQSLPLTGYAYRKMSETVVNGNQIIGDAAALKDCIPVDIYQPFFHHCYGGSLGDTQHFLPDYVKTPLTDFDIHPSTAGHRVIYQTVFQALKNLQATPVTHWEFYP